jgi:hypothetical protein
MAANPALVSSPDGLAPAPFQGETIALARHGVDIAIDGLRTANGKWSASGTLWLTDVRLVFVAPAANADGLQAFDFPLAYITHDKFNQPIFACNNLAGKVWPATGGGGPAGTLPPHEYKLYFKEGGVGTLLPLYYRLVSQARLTLQRTGAPAQANAVPSAPQAPQSLAATALVDPSDPSKIFLTQPVSDEDRLPSAPVYASNYGQDEAYEPMEPAAAGQQQQRRQPSAQAPLI